VPRPAVFVDRDGVINDTVPDPEKGVPESPLRAEDVRLLPGAAEALRTLREAGLPVVVVTNQPSAAKGRITLAEATAIQRRVEELLAAEGAAVDAVKACLHHPEGVVAGLSGPCLCRKPAPGLLLAAAFELDLDLAASWMIGDADSDVEAGSAAGCRTALVLHEGSEHRRSGGTPPDVEVASLADAAAVIVGAVPR
jgi:D-glycero-D-manno-heptose 1,7-bisphosphate phosphatase